MSESSSFENKVGAKQRFNEAMFKLCTVLYQIDGKVTLKEIDKVDSLLDPKQWENTTISIDNFKINVISECRKAVENESVIALLKELRTDLMYDANTAICNAYSICQADNCVCEKEESLLKYLENKLLAPALNKPLSA